MGAEVVTASTAAVGVQGRRYGRLGGKADMSRAATPAVRPPPIFGRRPCRSTVQVDPKANGATVLRKGRRGPVVPAGRATQGRCPMLEPDALNMEADILPYIVTCWVGQNPRL